MKGKLYLKQYLAFAQLFTSPTLYQLLERINNRWLYYAKLVTEKINIYRGNTKTININDITGIYLPYSSSSGAFIMIDKIFKSFDIRHSQLRKYKISEWSFSKMKL